MIGFVVVNSLVVMYSRGSVLDVLCVCISKEEKCLFIVDTHSLPFPFPFPFRFHSHKSDVMMTV